MHIGVYVGEYSLSPLYQTSDNTFIKRWIILLSNVQHPYDKIVHNSHNHNKNIQKNIE